MSFKKAADSQGNGDRISISFSPYFEGQQKMASKSTITAGFKSKRGAYENRITLVCFHISVRFIHYYTADLNLRDMSLCIVPICSDC